MRSGGRTLAGHGLVAGTRTLIRVPLHRHSQPRRSRSGSLSSWNWIQPRRAWSPSRPAISSHPRGRSGRTPQPMGGLPPECPVCPGGSRFAGGREREPGRTAPGPACLPGCLPGCLAAWLPGCRTTSHIRRSTAASPSGATSPPSTASTMPCERAASVPRSAGRTDRSGSPRRPTVNRSVDNPQKEPVTRLLPDTCEICGARGSVQVHHTWPWPTSKCPSTVGHGASRDHSEGISSPAAAAKASGASWGTLCPIR